MPVHPVHPVHRLSDSPMPDRLAQPDAAPSMTFTIVLRALPRHAVPPACRLRRLLKAALRVYGFRCVDICERGPAAVAQDRDQEDRC
jgi:hypothetical protein